MFFSVEAPDFVAGDDLRARLAGFAATVAPGEAGTTHVSIEDSATLVPLLEQLRAWCEAWELEAIEVRIRRRTYVFRLRDTEALAWHSADELAADLSGGDFRANARYILV